jgi:acetoin utilization deacetylase AcuC-like enzyme
MRYGVVLDEVFTRHLTPPGHPERPERIKAIIEAFDDWDLCDQVTRFSPVPADPEWILKVHSDHHYQAIKRTAGKPAYALDPDTHTGPDSFETSLLAVGSGIKLAGLLQRGEIDAGFLLARPPGHHAEADRAMGFCLFNNVAIVGQWAIENNLASRVAIIDFDVHHGNGTQKIFYSRADVLYVSSHQYPFYPGTGDFKEMGEGPGLGYNLNFPLRAGTGGSFYSRLYRELVAPVLIEYQPDLILLSAGYDGYVDDPLGGMLLTVEAYESLALILNEVASQITGNQILYLLEGGYNLGALSDCVIRTIEATLNPSPIEIPESQRTEFEAYAELSKRYFAQHWKCLA